jgi:hypothetical protein
VHRMRAAMATWLLIWLGSQPPDLATVSWLPETAADFAESDAVDMEDSCSLTLFVSGLHAGGDRELLLFGEVSAAPGTYRSFLLRSEDEAASWTEVMPPLPGSSVHDLSFTSPRQDLSMTVAPDGASWQVVEPEDWETLQILRLPADESAWTLMASLPRHYSRAPEGTLVPCERR